LTNVPVFTYMIRLAKSETFGKMSAGDEAIVDEHFDYLKNGLAKKKLIFAGRCLDRDFGIVVFRAGSEKEADSYMKNDPAVKSGLMIPEMHPFRVALIEKD
jgi:uncharacterized protein YciI